MATTWTRGTVNGIVGYSAEFPSRAVIVAGIDGGWTLDRDVTAEGELESFATLAAAQEAAA